MAAQPSAPPSYSESVQQNQGYPGYQPTYGTVNTQQTGPYQQGGMPYPPAGAYDPNKVAGAYNPGPYPPQGGYPPQPGYPPPAGAVPQYSQAHTTHTNVHVHPTQSVVVVGGCPACRVGILEEDFTCLGVLCAILFFPLGILCCLALRQRRCSHCGAVFG
ncbi:unnamed protein product [Candidula unifasciata]|uniref:Membrane protein BRI3 n=1 Tax=Candidula unifasciata TaxID=100452 RepID=A0A8S4A868_9EUPU|nr:unnamed protein product [Candidula unifasciata]